MDCKAFIFDFDDTLVSTKNLHMTSFSESLKKFGMNVDEKKIKKRFGLPTLQILEDVYPNQSNSILDKIADAKEEKYQEKIKDQNIRILDGVKNLLDFLKNKNYKIGIFSSDSAKNIEKILEENNLKKYFDEILGSKDVKNRKPEPDGLFKIAKKFAIEPNLCAFIGDSKYDMIAAKRARMKGIGISSGFFSKFQLKSNGAQITVDSHKELFEILKNDLS